MTGENLFDDWGDDAILKISGKELNRYLVRKRLEKICTCKDRVVLVDTINRRCECSECGAILDPFDVLEEITLKDHMRYNYLKYLKNEIEETPLQKKVKDTTNLLLDLLESLEIEVK